MSGKTDMKVMKTVWKKYRYLGYDKAVIDNCRTKMDEDNISALEQVSKLLLILVAILTVFYLMFDNRMTRNIICISGALCMLCIYFVSKKMRKSTEIYTSAKVDLLIDVFSGICFLVGIYLGTFAAKDALAVAPVWMFFFVILIFNRLPLQNLGVVLVAVIVFVICSYFLKSTHDFLYDTMHAATSILAAIFMSWSKSRMKIENIWALQKLESVNMEILETVKEQEWEAALLRHKASRDELTGLFNKTTFENTVEKILKDSKHQKQHALACLDLDDFKYVNDQFGHLFGDTVLKSVSETYKNELEKNTICSRFGGDEFVLFFQGIADQKEVEDAVVRVLEKSKQELGTEQKKCNISLSAGISFFPQNGRTYKELFEKADQALYRSKKEGKSRYTISQ